VPHRCATVLPLPRLVVTHATQDPGPGIAITPAPQQFQTPETEEPRMYNSTRQLFFPEGYDAITSERYLNEFPTGLTFCI